MPCYYTGSADGDARLAAEEALQRKQGTLTFVTGMLCEVCQMCNDQKIPLPSKIAGWWRAHQETDAIRKARQAAAEMKAKLLRKKTKDGS